MSCVVASPFLCDFIVEGLSYHEIILNEKSVKRRISFELLKYSNDFLGLDFDLNLVEYHPNEIVYYKFYDPLLYSSIAFYNYNVSFSDYPHKASLDLMNGYLDQFYKKNFTQGSLEVPWGIESHFELQTYHDEQLKS